MFLHLPAYSYHKSLNGYILSVHFSLVVAKVFVSLFFVFETVSGWWGSYYVAKAILQPWSSCCDCGVGIAGVCHCTELVFPFLSRGNDAGSRMGPV